MAGLQTQLNSLEEYCRPEEWSLKIKVQKTKIVIFRNAGRFYDNEKFYINNNTEIEFVINSLTWVFVRLHQGETRWRNVIGCYCDKNI